MATDTPPPEATATETATPEATATPSGLLAASSFDAGSGTILSDESGHGHTGTLINDPSWSSQGYHGGALLLDSSDDFVAIPEASDLHPQAGLTMEA